MKAKKWQLLEGIVAAIERSLTGLPGASVVPNAGVPVRESTKTRQVDVYVSIPIGSRVLKIGIEVRDERSPVDVTEIEQLNAKLSKLEVDRKCVVSGSGFTNGASAEARRCGIELHTLAEVSVPNWWLPTSVEVEGRHVELLHIRLHYGAETADEVIAKLQGVAPGEFFVVTPDESLNLVDIVLNQGHASIGKPELQQVKDQEVFSIRIQMELPTGSVLRYPAGEAPAPPTVFATFRLHRSVKSVPIAAYRMNNVDALTFLPGFDDKQLTFVSELQRDGSRRISLSIGDVAPKRTQIVPERQAD
jgi:hypothetical protein